MLQAIFDFFTFWTVTGTAVMPEPDFDDADAKSRGMDFHYATEESALGLSLFRD